MASSFFSSWPDRNSPFLSKIDFGVPLAELLKWLDVRDTFLGRNERKQDIAKALALARECKHPDAVWLTSIFEGKKTAAREQAREAPDLISYTLFHFFLLFLSQLLCFTSYLSYNAFKNCRIVL